MAEDILQKSGLYFDDLNKMRLLQPQTYSESCKLRDECQDFVNSEAISVFLIFIQKKFFHLNKKFIFVKFLEMKVIFER